MWCSPTLSVFEKRSRQRKRPELREIARPGPLPGSAGGEGGVHVGKTEEEISEPRRFQNRSYVLLHTCKHEAAAVSFHVLGSVDQRGQPGTIDIVDAREIDHQSGGFLLNHRAERSGYLRGNMEIDLPLESEDVR